MLRKRLTVKTRLRGGTWHCMADIPVIGEVSIGSGRTEYQAQHSAARFMAANYPDVSLNWEGGYHGGDVKARPSARPRAGYYKD